MEVDCDLKRFYGELAHSLPSSSSQEADGLIFDESNLAVPPPILTSKALCATWSYHFYNDFPIEQVSLEAEPETCRQLGLFLLACIFYKPERVTLELLHTRSTVRSVSVRPQQIVENYPGLVPKPHRFTYYPEIPVRHPWYQEGLTPSEMPVLTLTNQQEMLGSHHDMPNRDTVVGSLRDPPFGLRQRPGDLQICRIAAECGPGR